MRNGYGLMTHCTCVWLLVTLCAAYDGHLIKAVEDVVGAENFTYYTYTDHGPVVLVLQSLSGDADLYASAKTKKPTYLDYEVKSNTCGEDVLDLSQIKRPVYIGIFGSHAYDTTEYVLYVYRPYKTSTPDSDFPVNSDSETDSGSHTQSSASSEDVEEDSSSLWPFFEFLLHVLEFLVQAIL